MPSINSNLHYLKKKRLILMSFAIVYKVMRRCLSVHALEVYGIVICRTFFGRSCADIVNYNPFLRITTDISIDCCNIVFDDWHDSQSLLCYLIIE